MKNIQIISVDDTFTNLLIIEEIAKDIGFEVISFENPLEAYEYIQNNHVDLMFVDYMMPEMNGIELLRKIKSVQPDIIPIMITAVADDPELKKEALSLGVVDFLTKPFDMLALQSKIEHFNTLKQTNTLL